LSPSEDERAAERFLRDHAPPRRDPRVVGDLVRNIIHNTIQLTSRIQEDGAPRNDLAEDDPREIDDDEDQDRARDALPPVIVDSVRNFVHNTIQLISGI
jgi:hypothetical protein